MEVSGCHFCMLTMFLLQSNFHNLSNQMFMKAVLPQTGTVCQPLGELYTNRLCVTAPVRRTVSVRVNEKDDIQQNTTNFLTSLIEQYCVYCLFTNTSQHCFCVMMCCAVQFELLKLR